MVLRDHGGRILRHRRLSWQGVWRSKEAEAKALLEALSWVEQEGCQHVIFESDVEVVTRAMQNSSFDATEYGKII
ncbi:hypothetical protein LINPERHAP2_LOCUS35327 [Linum perenne]